MLMVFYKIIKRKTTKWRILNNNFEVEWVYSDIYTYAPFLIISTFKVCRVDMDSFEQKSWLENMLKQI